MISVLIADDHSAIRAGLRMILANSENIEIVAEASDGRAAMQNAHALEPDVILMDLQMPNVDGIVATRELADHGMNVLVLTTYDHDHYVFGAIEAGAAGFLLKTAEASEIVNAIERVAAGQGAVAPEVGRRLFAVLSEPGARSCRQNPAETVSLTEYGLTEREIQVLTEIGHGSTNKAIAREFGITVGTAKTHVSHILDKLEIDSRTQAALIARDAGLLA